MSRVKMGVGMETYDANPGFNFDVFSNTFTPNERVARQFDSERDWMRRLCAAAVRERDIIAGGKNGEPPEVEVAVKRRWVGIASGFANAFWGCFRHGGWTGKETLEEIARHAQHAYQRAGKTGKARKWKNIRKQVRSQDKIFARRA